MKKYYEEKFMEATEDMKKTWKIIKNIISRNKQNSPTESFVDNGKTVTDKNAIVQKFNDFFVNIGPTLASKIQPTQSCTTLDPTSGSGRVRKFAGNGGSGRVQFGQKLKFNFEVFVFYFAF